MSGAIGKMLLRTVGLELVARLLSVTFNVFFLVVAFFGDTFSRLLVNYYVFMSFSLMVTALVWKFLGYR